MPDSTVKERNGMDKQNELETAQWIWGLRYFQLRICRAKIECVNY